MVEEYCRSLLKVAVAQLCQGLGWHAIHTTPCDLLTDVLQRYLEHLARHSHRYAEQYGRTDPNLDDVGLAFSYMHVRLNELETYLKEVEPIPFAHPLPSFPVAKKSNLQIPQPGSRDCRERLEYIPEHMPPLVDIAGEFGEGLDAMDISHSFRTSFDADTYEPHTPLMSPTSPRGDKRELLSPTDYFAFKRLRMMDDGTPRELTALSMGVNGEITPKREGRLPVAVTPPQKPLVERRSGVPVIPLTRTDSKPDGLLIKGPKSPRSGMSMDPKALKGKGITPPKPKPKSPKHLFFSSGGTPSVFQVKPKSPAVVIIDKVKELMPSGSKNIKVMGPNIGTLLITTKKTVETPTPPAVQHSDDDKSPSPKKPSALDVYDFEDEDTKPKTSKTFDPCGELPDPSKAVLPSATLIRDEEEEVVANAASIEDTIESVISKMAQSSSSKSGKKNGKDSEREKVKEKGKEKSKDKGKSVEKGKGGLLDIANKSTQEKSSSKSHSLPPKLLFKHAWRESEGAITSAIKMGTSPGLAPKILIKTSESKDKGKDKKEKLKKSGDEKSSGKESKKERSKRKKEQLKKEKLKKKKQEKKRRLQEQAGKTASSSSGETQTEPLKQPTIAKLNIITKNPKSMKVRVVSQPDSPASSPSQDKSTSKQQKDKIHLKKKRKEKERKAKVKAAKESLKKAKQKDGIKKPGEKKDESKNPSEEPPSKLAKLTIPKLMLKIGSTSSSGEATKIFIKKPPEKPNPPPSRTRTSSSSSSSSSSSPSSSSPSPSPKRKSPPPSPPPRSPSPAPILPPPSPPPKKTPAPKKAPSAKKVPLPKKAPAASPPPSSPPPVPKSPPSPPRSPPPPKVPVTVPPVRKAASKAFSAIAKPTKISQPLSPGVSQPPAPFKGISVPTKASLKAPVEKPSTSKGGSKAASTQKAPGTPPPIGGVTVGGSAQRSVILETVGTVVSDTGEKIWICPNCKLPDDGSPMVGCDMCDDWYHWPCVGIKEEPKEDNWYCPRCRVPKKKKSKKKYK